MFRLLAINKRGGYVLPSLIFVMLFLTLTAVALATYSMQSLQDSSERRFDVNAILVAEAGAEESISEIRGGGSGNITGSYPLFTDSTHSFSGEGRYSVTVSGSGDTRTIESVGEVYVPAGAAEPKSTRKIRLVVSNGTGTIDIHTGPGGLRLNASSILSVEVEGVTDELNVMVNGNLELNGSPSIIGNPALPGSVLRVGNYNCPTSGGAQYPKRCTATNPITFSGSGSHIYADVYANDQTADLSKMTNNGLLGDDGVPFINLPTYDRTGHKASASAAVTASTATGVGYCGGLTPWPDNFRITGDVTINSGCIITVAGKVWISGTLEIKSGGTIRSNSTATDKTVMIDGSGGMSVRNNGVVYEDPLGGSLRFVTYYCDYPAVTGKTFVDCEVDQMYGALLHKSIDNVTIDLNNGAKITGADFFARWTQLVSNVEGDVGLNESLGGLLAQSITLSGNASLPISTNSFSELTDWRVLSYQRLPN